MQLKRLSLYLLINVIVSAVTTIVVLTVWDRAQRQSFDQSTAEIVIPTSAPTQIAQPVQPTSEPTIALQSHQVRSGETLGDIALEYDVTVEELLEINGMTDPDSLAAGQLVYVPDPDSVSEELPPTPAPEDVSVPNDGQIDIVSVIGIGDIGTERLVLGESGGGKQALAGWQLRDEDGNIYTFPQATLYENGQIVINTRAGSDNPLELFWGLAEAVWQSGEVATLYDDASQVQSTFQIP